METKYNWFALGVISSGAWCPVTLHCGRAFSLCEEYQLLSVNYIAFLQCVVSLPLDNECMLYNFSSCRSQIVNINCSKYILYV